MVIYDVANAVAVAVAVDVDVDVAGSCIVLKVTNYHGWHEPVNCIMNS